MALSKQPYKGTRDFFPAEKRVRDYLFKKMEMTANLFGYEPYDGPLIEDVELYMAKSGEELINEQIYSFHDRGKRFVAIRPEMTPTLARMVAQVHRESTRPIRWFSIPNLMRYEKPQKGRLREHWQFNCDIFGAPDKLGELEILQVAVSLLKSFGANESHFEVLINDREIIDAVFEKIMGLSNTQAHRIYKIVDKAKKVTSDDLKKMVAEVGISQPSTDLLFEYLAIDSFAAILNFLNRNNQTSVAEKFKLFVDEIENVSLAGYLKYDPTIVRGFDYYTGTVFEIYDKHPDNRRAICGGGAYANLLQIFNEPALPGIGFGLGDVTLKDFLQTHNLLPDFSKPQVTLLLSYQTETAKSVMLKTANLIREQKLDVLTLLGVTPFKKLFPLAEKKGAEFVGIIGEDELLKNTIQIKNMQTREQYNIDLHNINKIISICKKA